MYKVVVRKNNKDRRKAKIRGHLKGTTSVPRLSVFRSNRYIYAQLIDDTKGKTVVDTMAETKELHSKIKKTDAALEVGKLLAKKALEKKIKQAVFDRSGYKYHGRVKNVAEGAREGGLKI